VLSNLKACEQPVLTPEQLQAVEKVYNQYILPDLLKEKW
jgi:hypothetical protein